MFTLEDHWGIFLAVAIVVAAAAALAIAVKYALRYKLGTAEEQIALLGDDYLDPETEAYLDGKGVAIVIDAPADVVWQHIKQMGQDRAGWYSFEKLERLFTFDIHNHYTIHPEWQDRRPGQFLFYHQPPWGVGSDVTQVDEERRQLASVSDSRVAPTVEGSVHFVPPLKLEYFCWTWNFGALDLGEGKTLYITKAQVGFEPFTKGRKTLVVCLLGFVSYFMLSHQCSVLKRVCEGTIRINAAHE